MTRLIALVLGALAVSLIGCSTIQNTPKQDYIWEMGYICNGKIPEFRMNRVAPDGGRYWGSSTGVDSTHGGPWARYQACMQEQFKARPYLDWLKTRQAAAPQTGTTPSLASANLAGPIMAPVWSVGDEWEYAYKSPSDSGTYVWSVNRVEMLDGVQHYVIKTGTREIFYRVSDFAYSLERVDGVIVVRNTPARLSFLWPLAIGKTWEQDHRDERPVDRQITDRKSVWTVEGEETVAVLAGTFRTIKIAWRNRNTAALLYEIWYAPDVKQWVKIREVLSNGIREREMVSFKLKPGAPLAAARTLDGTFSGEITGQAKGQTFTMRVTFTLVQSGDQLVGVWNTTGGTSGTVQGVVGGGQVSDFRAKQVNPCEGAFTGAAVVEAGRLRGSYTGVDCNGPVTASFVVTRQ